MRREFKTAMLSGLVITFIGFVGLAPVQLGKSFFTVAGAADWSEGILSKVHGLPGQEGQEGIRGPVEIELDNGSTLPVDPTTKIKDANGNPLSWERLLVPCKIRFVLEKGVVKEVVLIEVLPR
jgi:hypothetical protein